MSELKDLIKKDLEEEFVPKFQELNKGMGIAPAGSGGGGKPPKPGMPPAAPKAPEAPAPKKPSMRGRLTLQPKAPKTAPQASGQKMVAKPKMPQGDGMEKQAMDGNEPPKNQNEERYHIYHKGHKLTQDHETVTIPQVNKHYGGVKHLESQGYLLVPHKPKPKFKKNEEIYAEVMGGYKPQFLGDIKELAKNDPDLAMAALPYELVKGKGRRPPTYKPKGQPETPEYHDAMAQRNQRSAGSHSPEAKDHAKWADWHKNRAAKLRAGMNKEELGTDKVIVGEHVPNKVNPPPKCKKLKDKDKGSGGQITKEEKGNFGVDESKQGIPANRVIEPADKKKVKKCGQISKQDMAAEPPSPPSSDDFVPATESAQITGSN